jgi:small subunit ribosomal protein S4
MSRNLEPKGKIVRRLGTNIFENQKYNRLLEKKPNPPGEVKKRRPRISEYGKQLSEKQKIRFAYGLSEKQFRIVFANAKKMKGVTGDNMLSLLERRLDNVLFRLGMASTRSQARQIVNHGHVQVNKRKVNIPSSIVKADDIITIKDKNSSKQLIQNFISSNINREIPEWLSLSKVDMTGTVNRLPEKADIQPVGDEQLVVEFYSK